MSRKERRTGVWTRCCPSSGSCSRLVRVIVNALQKRGGTIEHLRRLLKEQDLVDKVFDLVVPPRLGGRATARRERVPRAGQLRHAARQGEARASSRRTASRSCSTATTCGNPLVVRRDRSDAGRAHHARQALRARHDERGEHRRDGQTGLPPRDHLEAYAFAKVNLSCSASSGSSPSARPRCTVTSVASAVLCSGSGRRIFDYRWFDREVVLRLPVPVRPQVDLVPRNGIPLRGETPSSLGPFSQRVITYG